MTPAATTLPARAEIKNRRLYYLRTRLVPEGYFTAQEMQRRDAVLFGLYFDKLPIIESSDGLYNPLVQELFDVMDSLNAQDALNIAEEQYEEFDSDSDYEVHTKANTLSISTITNGDALGSGNGMNGGSHVELRDTVSTYNDHQVNNTNQELQCDNKKNDLLEELRRLMVERWLDGGETDFDYFSVDACSEYDDISALRQDFEDKYFDSEEPSLSSSQLQNIDTAIQDY